MPKKREDLPWPPSGFGARLRALREEAGMTQVQFAAAVHLNAVTLSKLENGHNEPGWQLVCACARVLGKALDDFLPAEEAAPKKARKRK